MKSALHSQVASQDRHPGQKNRLVGGALLVSASALFMGCPCPQSADTIVTQKAPPQIVETPPKPPEPVVKPLFDYPATRAEAVSDTLFGTVVADPYRWLEDASNAEVKEWMAAQDKFARARLAALPGRDRLKQRLTELFYVDSISAPIHRGKRFFYTRTHADREKAILYWKEGETGTEKVLIDPNTLSADGTTSLGRWSVTQDGKTIAFALRENNADEATLYVMDVATGKRSEIDVIPGGKYADPDWTPKGDGFYYTFLPSDPSISVADRPGYAEVRFHKIGTDPKTDPLVHEKTGSAETFIGPSLSRDGRWLFVYVSHGWNSTDVYYKDLKKKNDTFHPLAVGTPAQYQVIAFGKHFYIATNEGAPKWRVFRTDNRKPERAAWVEIIPESKDAVIDRTDIIGGKISLTLMRKASSEIALHELDGKFARNIPLPGIGATGGLMGVDDEDVAYFAFASFTQPQQIYKTTIKKSTLDLWAAVKLPIDATPYVVEQVMYPSTDGTEVSMFIVRRKDAPKDGKSPLLLYGYGGFSVSILPNFSSSLYPWLEAGGSYAVPNLRGGGEYGEEWHKAGMGARKQNVFDDYASAAKWLIAQGYTSADRLAIRGGSNGGLLVGAALTQHPELYRAVSCAVPLLDMVRYHKFGSGKTWIPEYGSADDEAEFKTLHAYSPYHRVKDKEKYPAVLLMSADSDDRVDPMHARKMAALLQAKNTSDHPILLRIEPHAGHGGADLVKQAVESSADNLAFLMNEVGLVPAGATAAAAPAAPVAPTP